MPSLPHEDGGHAVFPVVLGGGEDSRFVVEKEIVARGEVAFDVSQVLLLVDIDQHVPLDRVIESRSLDLPRLEHHVAVGNDGHNAALFEKGDDVQSLGEQSLGERIVE